MTHDSVFLVCEREGGGAFIIVEYIVVLCKLKDLVYTI